jgi:GNAT superfamily N-acetyltransferase
MPGFLHLDPDPVLPTDTDGKEQTGPMAAATQYLFCGHLPDREDEAEEAEPHRAVHYLDDAPYDWDDFFSQKVPAPVPEPDYLGQVWVTPDEDEYQAWWMRGGEHDCGCEIALSDGRIIGFCAYGVNHASEIGPLGTDEGMQRKGVAGVVIRRALAQLREHGHDIAEIGWAGPLPYFSRLLEARIGRVFWRYEKLLDAGTSPSVDERD